MWRSDGLKNLEHVTCSLHPPLQEQLEQFEELQPAQDELDPVDDALNL